MEDNVGVTTSMLNFGPRVGFAYRMNGQVGAPRRLRDHGRSLSVGPAAPLLPIRS